MLNFAKHCVFSTNRLHYGVFKSISSFRGHSFNGSLASRFISITNPMQEEECNRENITECWRCGFKKACCGFFCEKCNYIQPCRKANYFELLSIPIKYDIDIQDLELKYKQFQKSLHPDRFENKSKTERYFSESNCAAVNTAYATLKSSLARAEYLISILSKEKTYIPPSNPSEKKFLEDLFELHSKINDTSDKKELTSIKEFIFKKYENLSNELSDLFVQNKLVEANKSIEILRYYQRLIEEIDNKS